MRTTYETEIEGGNRTRASRKGPLLDWSVQVLLALVFGFAGAMKLVLPVELMTKGAPGVLPGAFVRFLGAAEVAGALGLLLPGLLRIQRVLTPLAAIGLAIIMVGAIAITLAGHGGVQAALPAVVGALSVLVVYRRRRWLAFRAPATGTMVAEQLRS